MRTLLPSPRTASVHCNSQFVAGSLTCVPLRQALAHAAPGLRSLDISLCVVTDVGVLAVITGCPQLERLSVAGLPITEGAVAQVRQCV